jgi:hypothetical protein
VTAVFVSRPSVVTAEQAVLCHRTLDLVAGYGFQARALSRGAYERDLWTQVGELLRSVDAAVILGIRQLRVVDGYWREGTADERPAAAQWSSPWMQIEAGMAVMTGMPVLVLTEHGVAEGIFDPQCWVGPVFGARLSDDAGVASAADEWARAIKVASRGGELVGS